jgi:hypothetical protein
VVEEVVVVVHMLVVLVVGMGHRLLLFTMPAEDKIESSRQEVSHFSRQR